MAEQMNNNGTPKSSPGADFESRLKAAREIAEKHGYYYSVLSDEEKIAYELADPCEGFDQEIKLLKAKLNSMQLLYPFNLAMIARFMSLMERLQRAQKALFKKDDDSKPGTSLEKMLGSLAIPRGLTGAPFRQAPGTA